MSEKDMAVLSEVQRLPLCQRPFEEIANRLGMKEEEVLSVCSELRDKGVIRRFGPSINHRELGFGANPMTVLKVPEDKVEVVGCMIASESDVTHCYARSGWEYNLFFMIHARNREEGVTRAEAILKKTGVTDYKLLFSIRELKKVSFEIPKTQKGAGE